MPTTERLQPAASVKLSTISRMAVLFTIHSRVVGLGYAMEALSLRDLYCSPRPRLLLSCDHTSAQPVSINPCAIVR